MERLQKIGIWFLIDLGGLITCLLGSCTGVDIEPIPWDNRISFKGEFLTENAEELQLPIKVLFIVDVTSSMGYIDEFGVPQGNDPYDLRSSAVQSVIQEFCGQPNYSFGIIRFAEDEEQDSQTSEGPQQPEDVTGGFVSCKDSYDLQNKFSGAIAKTMVADGWTPYVSTLALARKIIEEDSQNMPEDKSTVTRYVVIFFSDGEPCHLREKESGKWTMIGEDFDEIFGQIDRMVGLEKKVGDIILHTSYLKNDSADDCNNQWSKEIPAPADLLSAMASRGGGVFRTFNSADDINFLDLVKGSIQRTYTLSYVIADNLNATLGLVENQLVVLADTDGDGLSDWEEENTYHTDPQNNDTDGDGCRDGIEAKKGLWPLTGLQPCPKDQADPCGEATNEEPAGADGDNDGLWDREELLVTLTNRLRADTDGDGLPDGLEVRMGTNPHNDDIRAPVNSDEDRTNNWSEARGHTLALLDEEKYKENAQEKFAYQYQKAFIKNNDDGRKSFQFRVDNILLASDLLPFEFPRTDLKPMLNHLDVYFVQHAEGFGKAPAVIRKASYAQTFMAPREREPNRYEIEVNSEDLKLTDSFGFSPK